MKCIIQFLCLAVLTLSAFSQSNKPPVPDILNTLHFYNRTTQALQPLEHARAAYGAKAKALGFGGVSTGFELDGNRSPVRLTGKDTLSFIVALADGNADPSQMFSLMKLDVKKNTRTAVYATMKVYGGRNGAGDGLIPFVVRKVGSNAFELIPSQRLEKGEYFFVNKLSLGNYAGRAADAFAFGID